ncbi:HIT family protein [Sphingomonas sp. LHG3406-1]|uniref:HIT family protein n=1 Tax=Sphingomonas sp. LHG3406-1 TaxID=2804617 RepID=UPI002632DECA|nr:HIT family protein [Sphingomonas sp. LHG3406-1]
MPLSSPHATLVKFGYPRTLVHEGRHWAVLVRPAQPTLGSLVLCSTSEETAYGALPAEAFAEQGELVARIERMLKAVSDYERVNYLMLMMVDPHVHFHIIPRYSGDRAFEGSAFFDSGWPAQPDLLTTQPASESLIEHLRRHW